MKVDCIITSCGRFDLLEDTLDSLLRFNSKHLNNIFVYDDYGVMTKDMLKDFYSLVDMYSGIPSVKITRGSENIGQVAAIDFLRKHVRTDYYLHLEDDWKCMKEGFIPEAIKAMELGAVCVIGRGRNPRAMNGHPNTDGWLKEWNGWSGWCYAPTLHKNLDARYSDFVTWDEKKPWEAEKKIGGMYIPTTFGVEQLGAYLLPDTYFIHTGNGRTTLKT